MFLCFCEGKYQGEKEKMKNMYKDLSGGRSVRVAAVQMSMKLVDKKANLEKGLIMAEEAVTKGAKMILLPELFTTEYFAWWRDVKYFDYAESIPGPTTDTISELARRLAVYIVAPFYEQEGPGMYYNSAVLISPQGEIVGRQRKMHIPAVKSLEKIYFQPAEPNFPVFQTEYGKVAICICYDRLFPEVCRALALNGAELIFCPIAGTIFPKVSTLDTRALENVLFIVAANRVGEEEGHRYTGGSMIVDPEGQIIVQGGDKEEIVITDIDLDEVGKARNLFPYFRDRRPELYSRLLGPAIYSSELPNPDKPKPNRS
jgi:N-carbamoylputrescine amidase